MQLLFLSFSALPPSVAPYYFEIVMLGNYEIYLDLLLDAFVRVVLALCDFVRCRFSETLSFPSPRDHF